jgi:hypothetical protein
LGRAREALRNQPHPGHSAQSHSSPSHTAQRRAA